MELKRYELFTQILKESHTLICGVTGSGKSVMVNGIIYNVLCEDPKKYQLILIDPKRTELNLYKDTKHCIGYYSEPENMVAGLNQAMTIIESRYKIMQRKRLKQFNGSHVYVIIDELADLFTTSKESKKIIQRINQIGRAANVHCIGCTQTPITKVIPSEIKINFTCRIGLRCNTRQESRNVIEISLLETFPRYGKCYYMNNDGNSIECVPMYSEQELETLARLRHKTLIDYILR